MRPANTPKPPKTNPTQTNKPKPAKATTPRPAPGHALPTVKSQIPELLSEILEPFSVEDHSTGARFPRRCPCVASR